ncbi:MAG: oligosaccharide flippase family protein [Candidatus Eremiobacteraeota bacterium]|nr:oligosaccharide flippase family protein [Candidatus Eremiobacteraeota bacterium]
MGIDAAQEPAPARRGHFELRRFSGDATLVVGAAVLGNLFSFFFHFTLSRRLGPAAYGTLVTLMAVSSLLGALPYAIGTVAMQETARMWTSHLDGLIGSFVRRTARLTLIVAALTGVALGIASIPLRPYVHVSEPALWWLLGAYVAATFLAVFARGAAQGAHRFHALAASLISEGAAKVGFGFAAVALGYGVAGALGGLIASALISLLVAYVPLTSRAQSTPHIPQEGLRLGGEALKVLAVTAAGSALLFIDMVFAKHHLSGEEAGYFGAAGTLARTIPLGIGLIMMIIMPKAAAAQHVGREALARVLGMAAVLGSLAGMLACAVLALIPGPLIALTYGASFVGAAPLLRMYALDEMLLAFWVIASSYLVAVARYSVFWLLLVAVLFEATAMALFGLTPVRLLSIGIITNAALVPSAWALALQTVRKSPQADRPQTAETAS